ncbi:MAG: hypothetical protein AB1446_07175, partial [Bacillota bacterium]
PKARLEMVYPRFRGVIPRRKWSGVLFARPLNNAQLSAGIVEFRGTAPPPPYPEWPRDRWMSLEDTLYRMRRIVEGTLVKGVRPHNAEH